MIMPQRGFLITLLLAVGLVAGGCQRPGAPGAPAVAEVGKPAPGFTLKDTTGKSWSLGGLKGNLVFVNFWATWCSSCIAEMPSMEALHRELAGRPFQMLTILYSDDPGAAAAFAGQNRYTFPILIDPDGEVARAYGITAVPETFIVDHEGVLKEKFIGPYAWNRNPLKASIRRMVPPGS